MKLNKYQNEAMRTAVYPKEIGLLYTVLGLCGESGEVADKVKKIYRDHNGILSEKQRWQIADELGDVLWYLASVARELGISLEDVATGNLHKLYKRQKEDKIKGSGDNR